jgi:UDP-N-acetylglucosamine--N-acetylmuramyl-(pentapeptide) pyrophosphoryl-undecaprenol N-acetylglucosamine transferase
MQQNERLRVIISGGGTGGHVFPAISIANHLRDIVPNVDILFVGAKGKLEMEKVPAAGYKIIGLWISGLQRSLSLRNIMFPIKLISSLLRARKIIKDFKPHVVVGVGGYASGPILYMASRRKIPCLIQEQNSYAGLTNRLLARRVQKICVAYDNMDKFFAAKKIIQTGNPVRKDIITLDVTKKEALDHFKLEEGKPTVLVIGGSLGSRTINQSISYGLDQLNEAGIQVIWQTGAYYFEEMNQRAIDHVDHVRVVDFIGRMDMAYVAADIVVSRAGALAISEICVVGKPVVLVPAPNLAEDHQTMNALTLVEKEAAIMLKDDEAPDNLAPTILHLLKDEAKQELFTTNLKNLGAPDAAARIAREIVELKNGI